MDGRSEFDWLTDPTPATIFDASPSEAEVALKPYNGYHLQPKPDNDSLLTDTNPGSACGEYLRRYWQPFMLSSELQELPVPVRLMGEDLVVFRDKAGSIGLLHRNCAHRGTSLEFGIPAERGIRCCYHGWHFDVDGTILETPAEPPSSRIRENFRQGAYAVREQHGMLFAYMGPKETLPELPVYDSFTHPADTQIAPFKMRLPCNWLQIVENAADPMHNAFLHAIMSATGQFSPAFKVLPVLDYPATPLGFLSMATRKVGERIFIRSSDMMMPNVGQFPSGGNTAEDEQFATRPGITRWVVPVDNHNAFYLGFGYVNAYNSAQRRVSVESFGLGKMPVIGQTADRPYEERQREPGDYDAVVSQGAIANRKNEHLATSDRGVSLLRRMLTQAIHGERAEKPASGTVRTYAHTVVVKCKEEVDLADFGRRVAAVFVEYAHLPPLEREKAAEKKIRGLVTQGETA
jgi:nitrite reductase/ring-hydroxylating ferredoxin subunit